MRIWRVVIIGLAILAIGFVIGLLLAFYLQGQAVLLAGAAIVLALVAWLGSGADIAGLLRGIYKEGKEEERRVKSQIYRDVEPHLTNFRKELFLAKAIGPSNPPGYAGHLDGFAEAFTPMKASGRLRHISTYAPQVFHALVAVDARTYQPFIPTTHIQKYAEDVELPRLILNAIGKIDEWLADWDKWRD
jgi:hypothetical protein